MLHNLTEKAPLKITKFSPIPTPDTQPQRQTEEKRKKVMNRDDDHTRAHGRNFLKKMTLLRKVAAPLLAYERGEDHREESISIFTITYFTTSTRPQFKEHGSPIFMFACKKIPTHVTITRTDPENSPTDARPASQSSHQLAVQLLHNH